MTITIGKLRGATEQGESDKLIEQQAQFGRSLTLKSKGADESVKFGTFLVSRCENETSEDY